MTQTRRTIDLPTQPIRLAQYRLDWGRLRLDGPEASVKLTPKAGAVLAQLLAQPGATVSRAALFDAVWPGSYSSDEVLTQVVQELRRAFADRQRSPSWLVTVPKLGYRWEGPPPLPEEPAARVEAEANSPAATPIDPPTRRRPIAGLAFALAIVAFALLAWHAWRQPPAPLPPPQARPLLREPAQELEPFLDAAGRYLVYVRVDAPRFELRLRDLSAGSETTLQSTSDATLGAPALSPDGTHLAWLQRSATACALHTRPLAAEAGQVLARDCPASLPTSLAWSLDGAWIYYSRAGQGEALAQRSVAIHRIPAAGGRAERISDAGRWLSVDLHPRLSADGREIAFVRDGEGRNRVVLVAATGGAETEVLLPYWPYRVAWQADSLLFAVHAAGGVELWRGTRGGRMQQRLAREGAGPGFAVSADGARIVFERHRADDNLWQLDLRHATASPQQLSHETGSEIAPRISPDGSELAYLADASGEFEVHRRTLADGSRRAWSRLAPHVPLDLRWSPDGSRLVLIVGTRVGKRLAILQPDGSLASLSPALRELAPAQVEWAADGDLWVAAERDGRRELLRARGPDFVRFELALDRSIAAFALDDRGPVVVRPGSAAFERLDGSRASSVAAVARPSDQWSWQGGRIAQAIQRGGGEAATLRIESIEGSPARELAIDLPEPPLGRHLDLRDGTLWFARRDRLEIDLYQIESPPAR